MGFAYKFENPEGCYFVTAVVVEWVKKAYCRL
jgi:hypothetical protein